MENGYVMFSLVILTQIMSCPLLWSFFLLYFLQPVMVWEILITACSYGPGAVSKDSLKRCSSSNRGIDVCSAFKVISFTDIKLNFSLRLAEPFLKRENRRKKHGGYLLNVTVNLCPCVTWPMSCCSLCRHQQMFWPAYRYTSKSVDTSVTKSVNR